MEALLYTALEGKKVRCRLCNHFCVIKPGRRGICSVRENKEGVLYSLVYGRMIARHVDPIEKKPIYHMCPGSLSYSIASVGCNFKCRFCQNSEIAQMPSERGMIAGERVSPERIVQDALDKNCKTIAYTYTEPTISFEFAMNTAKLAHARGIKNIFVTNGYMSPEALEMIGPWLDAANVDLKAYDEEFYQDQCKAKLEPVKTTLRMMKSMGILVEVTTLLIPGLNDNKKELAALAGFISLDIGPETPWHISRFHPAYKLLDRGPTPAESLYEAREAGLKAGLRYVYLGNIPTDTGENTFCHKCGTELINRCGFAVANNIVKNGRCPSCGTAINGVEL